MELISQLSEVAILTALIGLFIGFITFKLAGLVVGLLAKLFIRGVKIVFAHLFLKFAEVSHSLRTRQTQFLTAWRK